MHIELSIQSIDGPVAGILLGELRAELRSRYPADPAAAASADSSMTSLPRGAFVVARVDGRLAGCGCIEGLGERVAEIKRLYVRPDARRNGVGAALVDELERTAIFHGVRAIHLDAGGRQPELMFLCSRQGYRFQSYSGEGAVASQSVRFAKELTGRAPSSEHLSVRPPLRRATRGGSRPDPDERRHPARAGGARAKR